MRVIVEGRLKSRSYETKQGEKRTVIELEVDEIGASLRSATAKVTRTSRNGGGQGAGGFGGNTNTGNNWGGSQPAQQDQWATPGGASDADSWGGTGPTGQEPPF